jgi:hypothetical protein
MQPCVWHEGRNCIAAFQEPPVPVLDNPRGFSGELQASAEIVAYL